MISYTFIFQGPWLQVMINYFAEQLPEFVSIIIDMHFLAQRALNLRNRRLNVYGSTIVF